MLLMIDYAADTQGVVAAAAAAAATVAATMTANAVDDRLRC
jgi:hypothetical protein